MIKNVCAWVYKHKKQIETEGNERIKKINIKKKKTNSYINFWVVLFFCYVTYYFCKKTLFKELEKTRFDWDLKSHGCKKYESVQTYQSLLTCACPLTHNNYLKIIFRPKIIAINPQKSILFLTDEVHDVKSIHISQSQPENTWNTTNRVLLSPQAKHTDSYKVLMAIKWRICLKLFSFDLIFIIFTFIAII